MSCSRGEISSLKERQWLLVAPVVETGGESFTCLLPTVHQMCQFDPSVSAWGHLNWEITKQTRTRIKAPACLTVCLPAWKTDRWQDSPPGREVSQFSPPAAEPGPHQLTDSAPHTGSCHLYCLHNERKHVTMLVAFKRKSAEMSNRKHFNSLHCALEHIILFVNSMQILYLLAFHVVKHSS